MNSENTLCAPRARPSAVELPSCAHCGEPDVEFDCNGLKFCEAQCGLAYLEPEFEIVNVTMKKTLSDQIKNGTRGFVVNPGDGLNQVNFENGTIAFCYMHELQFEQSDQ